MTFSHSITTDDRIQKVSLYLEGRPLSFAEVFQHWQSSSQFRDHFLSILRDSPFDSYRWETPCVEKLTANSDFEFVLVDSPHLKRAPDVRSFKEHLAKAASSVVSFQNLSRDATLVVPAAEADSHVYAHLASFVRGASDSQAHLLWQVVGQVMSRQLGRMPIWLNTAGAGVAWLHVRLDSRPKYYHYSPYKAMA
ncbi:MAG: hypothetical protein QGF00_15265 [Planctomycetota bacterium]|jgi:hypothetical protein|nr:hypothetical protein [Planctomycetota bacterium]MDP7250963.1 hypothetical protein [Planctomycetota bacterium]